MHLSIALPALFFAVSSSRIVRAQTTYQGDYTIIAGQAFPNSCIPTCQPFLDQNDACFAGTAKNKEEDCACSDSFRAILMTCAECVEQDPGVARPMQSIVRVLCPSTSSDDGTPSTSTDYDYLGGSPPSISSQIEAEMTSTTSEAPSTTSSTTSAQTSASASASASATTSVVSSTSTSASISTSSSSSSSSASSASSAISAASASVAPSSTPASGASRMGLGASVGGVLGALLAGLLAM